MKTMVENLVGEKLDVKVGGNEQAERVVIFVHGFGVDMHETGGLFDYEAKQLSNRFVTVQFSLSGCGGSGGKSEEMDYEKHARDLGSMIDWVRQQYPDKRISLMTHSMGGFVALLLSPEGIEKVIMVGLPNHNVETIRKRILNRFAERRGAVLNVNGESILPRSSGLMQKIGPSFWSVLERIHSLELLQAFSKKTKLKIIHMRQDEILGKEYIEEYHQLGEVKSVWIDGDHSVTKHEYRQQLMIEIENFL
jgi:pimeloyl-ACP methyl ester carboxylesterase